MDITYWWTADDGTPEGTLAHYAAVQGWVPVLSSMATLVAEKRKNDVLSPQYAVMSSVPADVNPLTARTHMTTARRCCRRAKEGTWMLWNFC